MALLKCPDCGKMVSSHAELCPFCGCPASFFTDEKLEDLTNENYTEKNGINEISYDGDKNDNEKEEVEILAEFKILGRKITYTTDMEIFIRAMKFHNELASEVEKKLREDYENADSMDLIWDIVTPEAQHVIDKVIHDNLGMLYKAGINMQDIDFIEKYNVDFLNYIKNVMEAYDDVINKANVLQQNRQVERDNRSYWEGGGFGLSGAIKGALTAGVLNTITGTGRSITDSIVDSNDKSKLDAEKRKLVKNEKLESKFLYGFRECIRNADIGVAKELTERKGIKSIKIDAYEARQIFLAASQYEKDEIRLAQKSLDAIILYPLEPLYYKTFIPGVFLSGDDDVENMIAFMDFWKMKKDFPKIFESAEKMPIIKEYVQNHPEVKSIDYSKFDAQTYIRVRNLKIELEHLIGSNELPILMDICACIVNYFEQCLEKEHTLDSKNVLNGLNDNDSPRDFIFRMHNEKTILPELLKTVWVFGDTYDFQESKLKNKWKLPNMDTVLMYQNNAIFGTVFGGEGFILTESTLCDLKSKTCIYINKITNAFFDGKDTITITDGTCTINIDLSGEKKASKLFLYCCLEEFVHRYSALIDRKEQVLYADNNMNSNIVNSNFQMSATQNTVNTINVGYMDNVNINEKSSTIFCPYCGKQISRTAKFCNYCGNQIMYKG